MAVIIGKGKYGQPILLYRVKLVNPKASTEERMKNFVFYTMESIIAQLPPDIDKYSAIVDFKDSGLSNINLKQLKEMAPIIQVFSIRILIKKDCYAERIYKIYAINTNWLLKIVWGVISPFLDEATTKRILFIKDAKITEELLKDIDENVIPSEYGGKSQFKFEPIP